MAREFDLEVEQGSDKSFKFPVTDGVADIDLTQPGWSIRGQVRAKATATTVLHEWSNAVGNITLGNGFFIVSVPHADSSAWKWTKAVYDMELTAPDGAVTRILKGAVAVSPEVTR